MIGDTLSAGDIIETTEQVGHAACAIRNPLWRARYFLVIKYDSQFGLHVVREINDGFLDDEIGVYLPHFPSYNVHKKVDATDGRQDAAPTAAPPAPTGEEEA